nr:unnamed protein product [Digitaria exilis]
MAIGGFVDWRGNLIKREVHGGVRTAWFMYFLTVVTSMVNIPVLLNLVTYLRGTMHMGVSGAATTVTNCVGATSGFALIGAFLSDSYITRSKAILLFGPLEFLLLRKRKEAAVQISLFWLTPQFFLLGVADVTSFPGLLEFFNSEAPRGMKSIPTALFWCDTGLASLLATLLVEVVNSATRHGQKKGWLEGTSLNNSHLDRFYWVVAAVELLGFVNYLYWAKRYVYHQDPLIVDEPPVDQDSP